MRACTAGDQLRKPTMRQSLILPPVQAEVYAEVIGCPYAGCGCSHVLHWQGGGLLRRARGVGHSASSIWPWWLETISCST